MVDRYKSGKKRSAEAQRDVNKKVSKWGKSSTKRQKAGLQIQADNKKNMDKSKARKKG